MNPPAALEPSAGTGGLSLGGNAVVPAAAEHVARMIRAHMNATDQPRQGAAA